MASFHTNKSTQGDEDERNFTVSGTSEFSTDMVFKSREDLMDWVQNMGRSLGYIIVTKRSKTGPSGVLSKVILMCDRGGVYKRTSSIRHRRSGTKKIDCPFKLAGKYLKMHDFWTLKVICEKHNHEPALHMEGHPYARRLSDNETRLVLDLTRKNVKPNDILSTLKEQYTNNVSTLRTIYNARCKFRATEHARRTQMQMPVHTNLLNVQVPPAINHASQNDSSYVPMDGVANGALSQAESLVNSSKKLEEELLLLGQNIKHHEEIIKHLKTQINSLGDQITDMQVTLGKNLSSITPKTEDVDLSHTPSELGTIERIMQHEKSAAGIVCQLKYRGGHPDLASSTNDILGVVAILGKVNDDKISRLLSEYLGLDTMLALVSMTYKGVEALETYDNEGFVSKTSGLHGIGASIGRTIDGRFNVICLENLRPYDGEFIPDDPQRRLALLKPKLPNGELPQGFLGFAVNMIHLDLPHYGLRETLFYSLFSRLQVYKTRAQMLQALPLLSDGAISLDGGIIRSNGVFVIGNREEMDVRFARSSYLPNNLVDLEKKLKELKCKMETRVEELEREEVILTHVKFTFEVKKQEFVRFLAQSSPYAMQYPIQATPTPRRSTPR